MRGVRAALPARRAKADVVLVAARYGGDGRLEIAKGHVRHDQIWSDVRLFDRESLIETLRSKKRVATAAAKGLGTDFELREPVELRDVDGRESLVAKGKSAPNDDLGLPIF